MPSTTPMQGFRVPINSDDPDVVDDMTQLARAIERRVVGVYASAADRDAKVTAPEEGQVAYLKDSNSFTFHTGTAWTAMFQQPPAFNVGTVVPDNSMGSNGDVFFKV